jgi:hypothetical protein
VSLDLGKIKYLIKGGNMEINIVDVRKLPSGQPTRIGKYDRALIYKVDNGENQLVIMPDEDWTEDKFKTQVQADIKERTALIGKKITI